ncbi:MAG TPA: ribonuclease PH [Candidatus Sulfobium mesophilum]|nr:ribonuclease PH [Candidatus Sulfobium mesophilum]
MRPDGRQYNEMREVKITRDFISTAEGSVLIELGRTRVICTATVEEKVPLFLKDQNRGWITAEYSMLPRATQIRTLRESIAGRVSGRTHEIQRLIGRSLRSVVDLGSVSQKTFWIDCDVIQADGGTRTAAITGAFICLADACGLALKKGLIQKNPIKDYLAAISVGIVNGENELDLCYQEDSSADVDMNIVMTGKGELVEIQGTAEAHPFSTETLSDLIALSREGIDRLISIQRGLIANGPYPLSI